MGPYCKFCDRRCFVPRIIPDGPKAGERLILATCEPGMAHDRQATGHDHTTATNPHDPVPANPADAVLTRRSDTLATTTAPGSEARP